MKTRAKQTTAHRPSESHRRMVKTKDGRLVKNTAFDGKKKAKKSDSSSAVEQIMSQGTVPTPDTHSANVSKAYAHISIEQNHMHNSTHVGSPLEQLYYSSPQGRMELDRRTRAESEFGGKNGTVK